MRFSIRSSSLEIPQHFSHRPPLKGVQTCHFALAAADRSLLLNWAAAVAAGATVFFFLARLASSPSTKLVLTLNVYTGNLGRKILRAHDSSCQSYGLMFSIMEIAFSQTSPRSPMPTIKEIPQENHSFINPERQKSLHTPDISRCEFNKMTPTKPKPTTREFNDPRTQRPQLPPIKKTPKPQTPKPQILQHCKTRRS